MEQIKGTIFNIQRFSVNDGPGIRTTVFLKGCMLNCLWCHNPESKDPRPQMMLYTVRCVGCGKCVKVCPEKAHVFTAEGIHTICRDLCRVCGACSDVCVGALETTGKVMTAEQVLAEVMKDAAFYRNSGGGITLSGGEPLFQFPFALKLLQMAKAQGLHTVIETCGHAPWEHIEAISESVDVFLWDVKESDLERHRRFTGVSHTLILRNLQKLSERGAEIVLRVPVIPGYNDRKEHLLSIGALAQELKGVTLVEVEPYHSMGRTKSDALGQDYPIAQDRFASEKETEAWISVISSVTDKPVKKA